ncbi:hypothetical protein Tco_0617537 [Tanacetum coccineum]
MSRFRIMYRTSVENMFETPKFLNLMLSLVNMVSSSFLHNSSCTDKKSFSPYTCMSYRKGRYLKCRNEASIYRLRDVYAVTIEIRMEQYLQCIDYTLWEIIENGNAPIVTKTVDGKETVIPPTIVEEKAQRRAELMASKHSVDALPK